MLCFVIINSIVFNLFKKCVWISAVTGYAVEVVMPLSLHFSSKIAATSLTLLA